MPTFFIQNQKNYDSIYLNLIFDGKEVFLNKSLVPAISLDLESTSLDIEGPYIVEFYKANRDLVTKLNTNLNIGDNKLHLPWVLNAKFVVFKDSRGNKLGEIDISEFLVCNENNTCEGNEEYLCPLDCKNANNPYYPFTQKIVSQVYQIEPLYPPSKIYNQIFLYSLLSIAVVLIITLIIFLRKK